MTRKRTARGEELSGRQRIRDRLEEIHKEVLEGFIDMRPRVDDQLDYWDIYNCELSDKQVYNGNAKLFVPIVHDAVDARKTRFTNQVFPKSGRYVDAVTENGEIPHATIALLEHYVRKAKLRSKVAPTLNRNGDIEGQYNVYVSWRSTTRHVVWRENKPLEVSGMEAPGIDDIEDIQEEIISDDHPDVEVIPDPDVLIWPATADTIEDAIEAGGGAAIIRRWTKSQIKRLAKDSEIVKDVADSIVTTMRQASVGKTDIKKEHVDAAGIKDKGKYYLAYEVWTRLKVDGVLRLCRCYLGGSAEKILGAKLNPYWCDKCPLISWPVEKVSGSFKGIPKVKPVCDMQYYTNDIAMEGADSATMAMLPITAVDPLYASAPLVLDLGARWDVDPNKVKFLTMPQMWNDAATIVGQIKQQVFQTLGVNPAMIPQSTGQKGQKRSQAEVANEQAVDILTTADVVTSQEEGIWTPLIERFAEYDAQFRTSEITVRAYGPMGRRVDMEKVPPLQFGRRYEFRWFGVEAARNLADIQGQIAGMNVLRGIPPNMIPGRKIDLAPLVEHLVSNQYGPRLAPLIFQDLKAQLSIDPETENKMLADGFEVAVSQYDDDPKHIQSHLEAMRAGDPKGLFRVHIIKHQMQMAAKAGAQQQQSAQGAPGGAGPGIAGQPRAGARPAQPRQSFGPPGQIRPDSLPAAGAVQMPRKM